MKKIIAILLASIVSVGLVSCSQSKQTASSSSSSSTQSQGAVTESSNTKTVDGLTLAITVKTEAVKGDRTKDNVYDDKGEYFADGRNIVKASEYKQIVVSVDIKNDTDKALSFGGLSWSAELQDGYKLTQTLGKNNSDGQVQSKSSGKYELYYVVKNDIKADKIKVSYLWIKNKDEFSKLLSDPNIAKMSKEEAAAKYKDVYTSLEMETDIQK